MSDLRDIFGGTTIPTAYRVGYISNFYREPSFRAIEAEFGITRPEILTLIFLGYREGVTAAEICEFSGHLKANISRAVIRLEGKGYLTRAAAPEDARRQLLYLTASGRALYDTFMPRLEEREAAMVKCLNARERAQLYKLLDKLIAHVPDWT